MSEGVLLVAHGARDPQWARPFEALAGRLRHARPGLAVELAYLDFIAPDVATAGARLHEAGCTQVTLLPLFLGAAGHVQRDLPPLRDRLAAAHPGVRWQLEPPIGQWPRVLEAMAGAVLQRLDENGPGSTPGGEME